ncbi:AIPR family protein [Patescibacteria group bacterium]
MANIRLQTTLKNKIQEVIQENTCKSSFAFIRLMLREIFELDEFEIDEAITDGGMDKGIDAIFEKEEDGENILYIIQSKYFEQNPDKSIDENTKNLIVEAISNYILGDYPLENLNKKLKQKVELYRNRLSSGEVDRVGLIFLTNGQYPGTNIISELDLFKQDQEGQIFYQIFTENDLSEVFLPFSASLVKEIDLKIVKDSGSGEKTILNLPDIDIVQGKVVKIDIVELARIVKSNKNIFSANVRAFQSIRNKVNEQIASTLIDQDLIKQFVYLNNGITIICDDFQVKPGGEIISLTKPSIINGCQTASTILEICNENEVKPNIGFILARIVKTKDKDIKEKIVKASNTQTAIKNRDLVSEDKIQKELETQFLQLGYFYDRKKGLYKKEQKEKIVDLEKAAQCYLSLYLQRPAEAKNKKNEIYKSYYEQIFNKTLSANQLLIGWILLNKINIKIKELRKTASDEEKSILGNSIMHLLPLFDEWAIKPSNKTLSDIEDDINILNELFNKKSNSVIKKMELAVKNIKSNKNDFNPQYFFKSNDSLNKILNTKQGEINYELELNKGNINRIKDLRYYKPDKYSFDGSKFYTITYWNDLFIKLIELYSKENELSNENLDFIDSGSRMLLLSNPDSDEKKIRKQMKGGLWLLTNFSSKHLSRFCFNLAGKMNLNLKIKLRPTRFRVQKKYKKK